MVCIHIHGTFPDIRIETRCDLADELVEWYVIGKSLFLSTGSLSSLKWVSWTKAMSALRRCKSCNRVHLFLGTLSPLALSESTLITYMFACKRRGEGKGYGRGEGSQGQGKEGGEKQVGKCGDRKSRVVKY